MERLTIPDVRVNKNTIKRSVIDARKVKELAMEIYWRLKAIEDVIADEESDEYDLERLRELAQADRDGRCVVLQSQYSETTGGEALRRAMCVCAVTNNEITRYTADAIAEKVVRESKETLKKLEGEKKA